MVVRNSTGPHLSLMADDILLSLKGLVAGFADKEPLVTVNVLFMDLQIAAVCKGLRAGLTAINHICFHAMVRTHQDTNKLQHYLKIYIMYIMI